HFTWNRSPLGRLTLQRRLRRYSAVDWISYRETARLQVCLCCSTGICILFGSRRELRTIGRRRIGRRRWVECWWSRRWWGEYRRRIRCRRRIERLFSRDQYAGTDDEIARNDCAIGTSALTANEPRECPGSAYLEPESDR